LERLKRLEKTEGLLVDTVTARKQLLDRVNKDFTKRGGGGVTRKKSKYSRTTDPEGELRMTNGDQNNRTAVSRGRNPVLPCLRGGGGGEIVKGESPPR